MVDPVLRRVPGTSWARKAGLVIGWVAVLGLLSEVGGIAPAHPLPAEGAYAHGTVNPVSLTTHPTEVQAQTVNLSARNITPVQPNITPGTYLLLTAHPEGGSGVYAFTWFASASPTCSNATIFGGTASTQVVWPSFSTYYCYTVTSGRWNSTSAPDLITVSSGPLYQLSFHEFGLPAGKRWEVSLGPPWANATTVVSETGADATFSLLNGTYFYLVRGPSGYVVTGALPGGYPTVSGNNSSIAVDFARGQTLTLTLAVPEDGWMPEPCDVTVGPNWTRGDGIWLRAVPGQPGVFANLTPATYMYSVVAPTSGQVITATIDGKPVPVAGNVTLTTKSVKIVFKFVYPYPVTFEQSGLPAGTNWSIIVRGVQHSNETGGPIFFHLPNGTYAYKVASLSGYTRSGSPKKVVVPTVTAIAVTFTAKKKGSESPTFWVQVPLLAAAACPSYQPRARTRGGLGL